VLRRYRYFEPHDGHAIRSGTDIAALRELLAAIDPAQLSTDDTLAVMHFLQRAIDSRSSTK
jgi:hypothetical protein